MSEQYTALIAMTPRDTRVIRNPISTVGRCPAQHPSSRRHALNSSQMAGGEPPPHHCSSGKPPDEKRRIHLPLSPTVWQPLCFVSSVTSPYGDETLLYSNTSAVWVYFLLTYTLLFSKKKKSPHPLIILL